MRGIGEMIGQQSGQRMAAISALCPDNSARVYLSKLKFNISLCNQLGLCPGVNWICTEFSNMKVATITMKCSDLLVNSKHGHSTMLRK